MFATNRFALCVGSCARTAFAIALAVVITLALAACPGDPQVVDEYQAGFDDGFLPDDDYIAGFDDSFLTAGFDTRYQGGEIPFIDDLSYDAGFYDGVFAAYNDGYYVAYYYALVIGFSEGYDNAYFSDFLDFLANDVHTEFANGGFDDGYDDGYTEGRIFGAFDFESALPFDWVDAFLDWESGTDLYFEEIDLGTGDSGPAILYEYGTDPTAKLVVQASSLQTAQSARIPASRQAIAIRAAKLAIDFARPLTADQINDLNVLPDISLRDPTLLRLDTTWLERIDEYNGVSKIAGTLTCSPRRLVREAP